MRTLRLWLAALAIVAAVFLGFGHVHERAMQRTAMFNARLVLERAYADYERTGALPPSEPHAHLSLYTNAVVVSGVTQQCAVALDWRYFRRYGFLSISTNRTVFWIDNRSGPRIIDGSYRAPLFGGGV